MRDCLLHINTGAFLFFFFFFFFENEEIFVQLDELSELDRITHAWIGLNYNLTQAQKPF